MPDTNESIGREIAEEIADNAVGERHNQGMFINVTAFGQSLITAALAAKDEERDKAVEAERDMCACIALAIDSGRGNEKEIAYSIRRRAALQTKVDGDG